MEVNKPLQESKLIGSVLGVLSLLKAADKLAPPPVPRVSAEKKKSKLCVSVEITSIVFRSVDPQVSLTLRLQDLKFTQTAQRNRESIGLVGDGKKNLETLSFEASPVDFEIKSQPDADQESVPGRQEILKLTASILKLSGTIDILKDRRKNLTKLGIFRIGSLKVTDASQSSEVVLMAAPSSIRGEAVLPPLGDSAKVVFETSDLAGKRIDVDVSPIAVLISDETGQGLKNFFGRIGRFTKLKNPLNPMDLVREDADFPERQQEASTALNLRIQSTHSLFIAKKQGFLTVKLQGLKAEKRMGEDFHGTLDTLMILTKFSAYPSIVERLGDDPMLTFSLNSTGNSLHISSKGLQFWFLNRFIEDLVGFIKALKTPKSRDFVPVPPSDDDFSIDLSFENAVVHLPSSSRETKTLVFEVAAINVTNGMQTVRLTVPKPLETQPKIAKKNEVEVDLGDEEQDFLCDLIKISGRDVVGWVQNEGKRRNLGSVSKAEVVILTAPSLPPDVKDLWNLDVKVVVHVEDARLKAPLADLLHLGQIIDTNIEEKSLLFGKVFKYEKTDFDIGLGSGSLDLLKWINPPSEVILPQKPVPVPDPRPREQPPTPSFQPSIGPIAQETEFEAEEDKDDSEQIDLLNAL